MTASASAGPTRPAIGFIGIGRMGAAMATRLHAAGHDLQIRDSAPAAVTAFIATHPGTRDASAGFVDLDILILMLPDSDVVEHVLEVEGIAETLRPGTLVLDMSSSEPLRTRALAARLAERGIRLADAPVSGGVRGAVAGTLSVLFGGDEAELAEVRPLLDRMARVVIHVGPVGAGHAAKALNNLVSAASVSITAEALHAAAAFGIEPSTMTAVLNASSGRSNTSENKAEQFMLSGTFDSGFALSLMAKDVGIGVALASNLGVSHELADAVAAQWRRLAFENPGADHTSVYNLTGLPRPAAERTSL